ncbi:hypothetical protein DMN91_001194 [Ooceraea biroi]|uniref:Uncharacterized protein n=1 Tax=Ooceraea biroi TaxID=2015173 RepID=A0A3L8E3R9_OOCBI|nr:hypothetical protein DMN91_001194 [Ooceraea biroi]
MMTALAVGAGNVGGGSGALSVVQAYCSSDTKQSAYKVAAAFAAEKAKPRRVGGRRGGGRGWGMVHRDRGKEAERLGARKTEGTRESQWYQRVGVAFPTFLVLCRSPSSHDKSANPDANWMASADDLREIDYGLATSTDQSSHFFIHLKHHFGTFESHLSQRYHEHDYSSPVNFARGKYNRMGTEEWQEVKGRMKRVIRSSVVLIFSLRACSLVYLTLAIFAFGSAEIDKHGASKTTKVGFDSIKNPKKSALFLQQHGKVEGDRNQSASGSAVIGDEGNSAALNRFLEHVLRVQNNLKWMDHATRHVNRGPHLDDPYTEQHSAVSANTGDVLEQADIGYGSGLRGKRGFDRNYEAMWMPQKKKYERESARDVPQRVYLDNEIFKRDAEDADFRVPYRFPDMLDRAVYEGGMMADQPLKDWTRKRDLHSSGDWSNSNENLEVTNGEDLWLRDYKPARETLVNSANDVDEDSRRRLEDRRSNTEKLGVAARKIPRVGADDGQSKREKDTGLELPRGNTARGFGAVANESRCRVVETTTIVGKGVLGVNGTRKESREPISGMIKVFEPRGRPYQKQGVEATVRLSQLMGEDGTFTGWMRTSSDVDVGESRNANGEDSSNLPAIDPVAVATARPKAASAMTPKDFAQMIVDNDSRGQQQMVLPLSGGNRSANKSNGNSDTDGIDIRAFGSNGNETMNVKEAARPIARPPNPENAATAEKVAMNHDEKQESDEEYLNQSAEELKEDYNDREEDAVEENDKIVEDERDESSSSRKFDPIKARVNMLIKQKLEKKSKNKDSDSYKRRKRDMLNMIEYYNYDGDEEQERNAPVNEQESKIKDDEFSNKDNAKIKRGKRNIEIKQYPR